MTSQQHRTIQKINAAHEAERFTASQASREVAELDVLSVYYVIKAHIEAGRIEEAKAIAAEYRKGTK
jgi:hypothetical protein